MSCQIKIQYKCSQVIQAFDITLKTAHTIASNGIYDMSNIRQYHHNQSQVERNNYRIVHTSTGGGTEQRFIGFEASGLHSITQTDTLKDLFVFETGEAFLDDLELVYSKIKLVSSNGTLIPPSEYVLRARLNITDPKMFAVYYVNNTNKNFIGTQIEFEGSDTAMDVSNIDVSENNFNMRLFTGGQKAVTIFPLDDSNQISAGNISANTESYLYSAKFKGIPNLTNIKLKKYIIADAEGIELSKPLDASMNVIYNVDSYDGATSILKNSAYLLFDTMDLNLNSPAITSIITMRIPGIAGENERTYGPKLYWETGNRYLTYSGLDKIEIWRRDNMDVTNISLGGKDYSSYGETQLRSSGLVKRYVLTPTLDIRFDFRGNSSTENLLNWNAGNFIDPDPSILPEKYYEYVLRAFYNTNITAFSKSYIVRFCPPVQITRCPTILLPRNNVLAGNTLSENRRFSQRVRGNWGRW